LPLAFRPGYAVFPCRPPLANNFTRCAVKPLVRFRRPPGLSRMTASRGLSTTAPSLGFAPSWHMRSQKVRFTRAVPDSPPSVPRVSCHPLDGLLPFAPCQPCFRPTAPIGFSLRSLLLAEVEPAFLPIFRPACRYHRPCFDEPFGLSEARGLSIDSRVLPRANPLHSDQVFSPIQRRMLPWVLLLSGIVIESPWSTVAGRSPLTRLVHRPVAHAMFRRLRVLQAVRLIQPAKAGCPSQDLFTLASLAFEPRFANPGYVFAL
jgi:hypothetical protein